MGIEYEVKILDINLKEVLGKLKRLGAERVSERILKRYIYDLKPKRVNSWMRLRDEGDKITLTIKEVKSDMVGGTHETEIVVSSLEDTKELLDRLGFQPRQYQESKRISYTLNGVLVEIDFWPLIPPLLEIEGKSVKDVHKTVKLLGFRMEDTTTIHTSGVYKKYGLVLEDMKDVRLNSKSPSLK
jgi:adenylate cyclase, class 2